jgi:small subunit ribosomal protein S17
MAEAEKKGPTPKADEGRGNRRLIVGRVVNDTANAGRAKKTVVVEVVRRLRDPVYGKYVKRAKRFHAHDETEQFKTNDLIEIRESRPLSATKRWVAVRLVERPEEV